MLSFLRYNLLIMAIFWVTQHGERSWHNFHSPVNKRWFVPEKVKSLNSSSEGKEIKAGCASRLCEHLCVAARCDRCSCARHRSWRHNNHFPHCLGQNVSETFTSSQIVLISRVKGFLQFCLLETADCATIVLFSWICNTSRTVSLHNF